MKLFISTLIFYIIVPITLILLSRFNKSYEVTAAKAAKYSNKIYTTCENPLIKKEESEAIGEICIYEDSGKKYVVFRGTNPFSYKEIKTNFEIFAAVKVLGLLLALLLILIIKKIKSKVEELIYSTFWRNILNFIFLIILFGCSYVFVKYQFSLPRDSVRYKSTADELISKSNIKEILHKTSQDIVIAGHSKGGAEAAILFKQLPSSLNKKLYTFGSYVEGKSIKDEKHYLTGLDTVQALIRANQTEEVGHERLLGKYDFLILTSYILGLAVTLYLISFYFNKIASKIFAFILILGVTSFFIWFLHSMTFYNLLFSFKIRYTF